MINQGRVGATQAIAFDASAAITDAFGTQTYRVRLASDQACNFRIGDGAQTATAADAYLPANFPQVFAVTPGQRISAIKAEAAGTLWVTELS